MAEANRPSKQRARGAITRADVAKLAGVSTAVVSYVVNGGPRPVAQATRARVQEAIERLGYVPNTAARSLTTGRADLIALVVPDITNPYFASLAEQVEEAARARGVQLILVQASSGSFFEVAESLSGHLVAGIITASLPPSPGPRERLNLRMPIVKLGAPAQLDAVPSLWADLYGGSCQAVAHLIDVHGHQRIGMIAGPDAQDERDRAWAETLTAAGLPTTRVARAPWSAEGGRAALLRLLDEFPDTTAAFVASDQQCIGALSGLFSRDLSAPRDLALVSVDGSREAAYTLPPLTTVDVPLSAIASDAVATILDGTTSTPRLYPTHLTIGQSCGCDAR